MLVKNENPSSVPEANLAQKMESKNLEMAYLEQKFKQKNQAIRRQQEKLERKNKRFVSIIKKKIKSLITRKSYRARYVVQYPEAVILSASHLFDRDWYLAQYPEVNSLGIDPVQHYLLFGGKNGYDPSPHFSTSDYLALYPDVYQINPLVHYELFGKAEGRKPRIEPKLATHLFSFTGSEIKIVFISGEPDTPGHTYRISRYAKAAMANGAVIMELSIDDAYENLEQITFSNVLILWRVTWNKEVSCIFSAARKARVPVIFDIDDLLIDPNLANEKIIDGIRTTGSTEQEAEEFFESMQTTMEQADYCSATTNHLANYMRSLGKRTFVLPNGFDERTWEVSRLAVRERLNSKHDGLIRLGYAGGSRTHQKDFAKIADVIARLLREHAHYRLVLFRLEARPCVDINEFSALLALKHQIEWREMVPLQALPSEMARFDINLAPLEVGNSFCEAKSELKFFESALVEVPMVASPTQTFCEAIENGKTGFLAHDEANWYHILSKLLNDGGLRKQIGRCAYYSVLWKYGSERRIELLSSMLETMLCPGPRAARVFELHLLKAKNACYTMPTIPAHTIITSYHSFKSSEVTVVVSCYNDSQYLIDALESVKNQTLYDIDLIIVDDCSTDQSMRIATQWLEEHKVRFNRVLLIENNTHSGLGLTRNVGFANAETLFVLPLDTDHRLLPDFVTTCLTTIKETNAAFVYPSMQRLGEENWVMNDRDYDPVLFTCGNYIDATALIRLSAWAYVGGYHDLKLGSEAYDFWCQFVEHGLFGYHVNEILAEYYVHEQSMNQYERATIHHRHSWCVQHFIR